jgi:hypothetical protein
VCDVDCAGGRVFRASSVVRKQETHRGPAIDLKYLLRMGYTAGHMPMLPSIPAVTVLPVLLPGPPVP